MKEDDESDKKVSTAESGEEREEVPVLRFSAELHAACREREFSSFFVIGTCDTILQSG